MATNVGFGATHPGVEAYKLCDLCAQVSPTVEWGSCQYLIPGTLVRLGKWVPHSWASPNRSPVGLGAGKAVMFPVSDQHSP